MSTPATAPRPSRNALSYRNYRRFWLAALFRAAAYWCEGIGLGSLIFVRLDQPLFWSLAWLTARPLAAALLAIPAGSLADRYDPYRLALVTQFLMFAGHGALVVVVLTDVVEFWMVIAWAVADGVLWAVAAPAMHTLLPRLVDRRAMPSAVALISGIASVTRIAGTAWILVWVVLPVATLEPYPAMLVALTVLTHGWWALATAAVLGVLSFVVLLTVRVPPRAAAPGGVEEGVSIAAGMRFVFGRRIFLAILGLSFFLHVFGGSSDLPVTNLMFERTDSLGLRVFMLGVADIGALAAVYAIVRYGLGPHPGVLMLGSAATFGVLVAASAIAGHLAPGLVLLLLAGFAMELPLVVGLTVLQLLVPDRLRGRVMGIWATTYFLTPFGVAIGAVAAEFIGARITIAAGALSVAAFAIVVYLASAELRHLRGDDVTPPPAAAEAAPDAAPAR